MSGWTITCLIILVLWALRALLTRWLIGRSISRGMGDRVLSDPSIRGRVWKRSLLWFVPSKWMWRKERAWIASKREVMESIPGRDLLGNVGEQIRRA